MTNEELNHILEKLSSGSLTDSERLSFLKLANRGLQNVDMLLGAIIDASKIEDIKATIQSAKE